MERSTWRVLLQENCDPLHAVACHPKQPAVVMGNCSGSLKIWDYRQKRIVCRTVLEKEKEIRCVTIDPQGEYGKPFEHLFHLLDVHMINVLIHSIVNQFTIQVEKDSLVFFLLLHSKITWVKNN